MNILGVSHPLSRPDSSCRNSTATINSNYIKKNYSQYENDNSTSMNLSQMYARGYCDVVKYANVAHAIIDVLEDCGIKNTISPSNIISKTSSNRPRE